MGEFSFGQFSKSVAVADTTIIGDIVVPQGAEILAIEIANANTQALDAFEVHVKVHGSGNWLPIATLAADFTSPSHPILRCTADLTALPADGKALLLIHAPSLTGVRLIASAAVGATVVTIRWSA